MLTPSLDLEILADSQGSKENGSPPKDDINKHLHKTKTYCRRTHGFSDTLNHINDTSKPRRWKTNQSPERQRKPRPHRKVQARISSYLDNNVDSITHDVHNDVTHLANKNHSSPAREQVVSRPHTLGLLSRIGVPDGMTKLKGPMKSQSSKRQHGGKKTRRDWRQQQCITHVDCNGRFRNSQRCLRLPFPLECYNILTGKNKSTLQSAGCYFDYDLD